MSPIAISSIVFACVFGAALLGRRLGRELPEEYVSKPPGEVIKLTMSLVATMSALVLALVISSASASFSTQRTEVTQVAADFALLDRVLAHYGPETKEERAELRTIVADIVAQFWSGHDETSNTTLASVDVLMEELQRLQPTDELHRALFAQAMAILAKLGELRALLAGQSGRSLSTPFLVVLVFWLAILFLSFGLFAPKTDAIVGSALLLGALSVSCAIFLVLELDQPFQGLVQISSAPLLKVAANIGK